MSIADIRAEHLSKTLHRLFQDCTMEGYRNYRRLKRFVYESRSGNPNQIHDVDKHILQLLKDMGRSQAAKALKTIFEEHYESRSQHEDFAIIKDAYDWEDLYYQNLDGNMYHESHAKIRDAQTRGSYGKIKENAYHTRLEATASYNPESTQVVLREAEGQAKPWDLIVLRRDGEIIRMGPMSEGGQGLKGKMFINNMLLWDYYDDLSEYPAEEGFEITRLEPVPKRKDNGGPYR